MSGISIFVLTLVFELHIGVASSSGFRSRVSKWQESYKRSDYCDGLNCGTQVDIAKKKGKDQSDDDIKAAVEIINMYSSEDPKTYEAANAVLRGDSKWEKKDDDMLIQFASLLEESIERLCKTYPQKCGQHGPVYRGQCYDVSIACPTYTFDSFLSTSKKLYVAEDFYKYCPTTAVLFLLEMVEGIYIPEFSQSAAEEEVLVKPKARIKITKNLNSIKNPSDLSKIAQIIQTHHGYRIPKVYIGGTMAGLKRSIIGSPCVSSSATYVHHDPKYVTCVLAIFVLFTYLSVCNLS